MPGGFHPFHAGHLSLYQAAQQAFPDAEVFVAATDDTSNRPFPFRIKQKLAELAGVDPAHFFLVKSPFSAKEITQNYDPATTELIFVRSEKDRTKPPQAGGVKKNGEPSYLQPLTKELQPMSKHAYMTYLPTITFGPGITSATEIRDAWPKLTDKRKQAMVMSLYPKTQGNPKLVQTVIKMLDTAILGQEQLNEFLPALGAALGGELAASAGAGMLGRAAAGLAGRAIGSGIQNAFTSDNDEDYLEEKWSEKYKRSIDCSNPRGFSQRAHCQGRKK